MERVGPQVWLCKPGQKSGISKSNVCRGRRFGGLRTRRPLLEEAAPPADRGAQVVVRYVVNVPVWRRTAAASGGRRGGGPRRAATSSSLAHDSPSFDTIGSSRAALYSHQDRRVRVIVVRLHGLVQVLGVKVRGGNAYQVLVGQIARHLATSDGHHRE